MSKLLIFISNNYLFLYIYVVNYSKFKNIKKPSNLLGFIFISDFQNELKAQS